MRPRSDDSQHMAKQPERSQALQGIPLISSRGPRSPPAHASQLPGRCSHVSTVQSGSARWRRSGTRAWRRAQRTRRGYVDSCMLCCGGVGRAPGAMGRLWGALVSSGSACSVVFTVFLTLGPRTVQQTANGAPAGGARARTSDQSFIFTHGLSSLKSYLKE